MCLKASVEYRTVPIPRELEYAAFVNGIAVQKERLMELAPALNERLMKAIEAAIENLKPRPAADRLLVAGGRFASELQSAIARAGKGLMNSRARKKRCPC